MKKLDYWPPRKMLLLARVLVLAGLVPLAAGWVMGQMGNRASLAWIAVLCILAIILVIAGLVLAYGYLRCPYCGASLCHAFRLPTSLPLYCPQCGKPLDDADR